MTNADLSYRLKEKFDIHTKDRILHFFHHLSVLFVFYEMVLYGGQCFFIKENPCDRMFSNNSIFFRSPHRNTLLISRLTYLVPG